MSLHQAYPKFSLARFARDLFFVFLMKTQSRFFARFARVFYSFTVWFLVLRAWRVSARFCSSNAFFLLFACSGVSGSVVRVFGRTFVVYFALFVLLYQLQRTWRVITYPFCLLVRPECV